MRLVPMALSVSLAGFAIAAQSHAQQAVPAADLVLVNGTILAVDANDRVAAGGRDHRRKDRRRWIE